jgi:hypothetical protein
MIVLSFFCATGFGRSIGQQPLRLRERPVVKLRAVQTGFQAARIRHLHDVLILRELIG